MSTHSMLLFVLAAVAVIVVVRWVAARTGLPAAALLPLIGIVYALLPGPNVGLDPDLVLMIVLPPLLEIAGDVNAVLTPAIEHVLDLVLIFRDQLGSCTRYIFAVIVLVLLPIF